MTAIEVSARTGRARPVHPRAGWARALSRRGIRVRMVALAAGLVAAPVIAGAGVEFPRHDERSVYDLAGVVSAEHEETMERSHRRLLEKTGAAIAVVTLPRLDGATLEEVLSRAGPEWGLGREDSDRGIVVALAMEERQILIATGHGVEDFLPDERINLIIGRFIVPRLQRGDVTHAMLHASGALISAASQRYGVSIEAPAATSDTRRVPEKSGTAALIVVLFLLALAARPLIGRLAGRVPRRAGGAGGAAQ